MNSVLKKAISTYGAEAQIDVAIEEMAELIKELIKYRRYGENRECIAEEIADVEIMLEQVKYIYNITLNVEANKEVKVERLKGRLDMEGKA